jgi:hypothetical protein
VFGHRPRLAHSHRGEHSHHLRRQVGLTIAVATLLAVIALLLLPPHANGNFVYWTNDAPGNSIGRAKINGTGLNDNFVTGLNRPIGVAVDSKASSFTLPVKPIGKTAKKLNKQIKKQLLKKRKAKAKVKQQVFITFVPAGVAGVPNTEPLTVKLVKTRTKKK